MHTTYSGAIISAITAHACYTCGSNGKLQARKVPFISASVSISTATENRKKQKKTAHVVPVIYTAVPGAKLTSAAHKRGPSRLEGCGGGSRYYASSSDKQRPARQSSGRHRLGSGSLMCVLMVGRMADTNVRTQLTYVRQGMTTR